MKVITHELDCEGRPIQLLPLSDIHIGDAHCDISLVKKSIERINNTPGMYTILDGDLMNTAIAGSKSDIYGETMNPSQQLAKCTEIFQPLADKGKILAILPGNHEERIARSVGVSLTETFAAQLGLHDYYSATSALLFLRFGKNTKHTDGRRLVYSIYANHGNGGGGRRAGGKINAMEDMAKIIIADVYVMGHTHQPATFRKAVYVPNHQNNSVSLKEQVFVNTAAFLDWSGSYGDRAGFQPNSKQAPVITLDNTRHNVTVTL